MNEIIKTPTQDIFYNNIINAKNNITLCSPFIKENIINDIIKLKSKSCNLSVITSSNIASFVRKASDIEAIENLISLNYKVYNFQNLHAKIYLFDNQKTIITSANLTYSGLNRNYEYGIISDDNDIVNNVIFDLDSLINSELTGIYDTNIVKKIKSDILYLNNIKHSIVTDEIGDEILKINNIYDVNNILSEWEKDVYEVIINNMNDVFKLDDIYKYEEIYKNKHPKNNFIKEKIRQVLQNLRDKGFIKFIDRGIYKIILK